MRRALVTTCLGIAVYLAFAGARPLPAQATEVGYSRRFGLGFMLGNPTGLSAKYWLSNINALDFGLGFYGYGWGWRGCNNNNDACWGNGFQVITIHGDYLWQSNLVKGSAQLDWHLGAGGRVEFWGDRYGGGVGVGVRAPIGIDLMFTNPGFLELFFELAPALYFAPVAGFGFEGALGVRLYF
jgi:hypothetical protein